MFKGPGKIVRDNKSSSYPVFELTGVNCTINDNYLSLIKLFTINNKYLLTVNKTIYY